MVSITHASSICHTHRACVIIVISIDTFIQIYCSSFSAGYYSV